MENLGIYESVRQVPPSAQREIQAGRLKGKTDINPMWRIKALTEQFGPCGIGWKYTITDKRLENGANNEVSAFVDIDLLLKSMVSGQMRSPAQAEARLSPANETGFTPLTSASKWR